MQIARLKLNYFRNYEALDLRPRPGLNVIVGENAQGKTNAVEAIFFCQPFPPHGAGCGTHQPGHVRRVCRA